MFHLLHLVFLSCGCYFLYLLWKIFKNHQRIKHIPTVCQFFEVLPVKIPLLSTHYNFSSMAELERSINLYGDPETKTLGIASMSSSLVWISDPQMLKELFITKGHSLMHFTEFTIYFDEENILSAKNNEKWKRHAKVLTPAFIPKTLKNVCKVAVESCDSLFEIWNSKLVNDGSLMLDIDDFSNLTLDVLGKSAFNIDFGIYSHNDRGTEFRHCMEKILSLKSIMLQIVLTKNSFMYNVVSKLMGIQYATDFCSQYLDEIIEERKKMLSNELFDSDKTFDIFSLLVDANIKEGLLSKNELKSDALMLSVAGHETSATNVSWICYHLSKSPEIQKKLREEVNSVLKGRNPTYEDVQSLPYTNAIILESLRLHSPVNHLIKIATKDTTLGKYQIPKGTQIHAMLSFVQRREDIWENPTEFKPERFLDNSKDTQQNEFKFAAFSFGNRICLGKQFSLVETCMILAKLVQNYEFKLLNNERLEPISVVHFPVVKPTNLKIEISKIRY